MARLVDPANEKGARSGWKLVLLAPVGGLVVAGAVLVCTLGGAAPVAAKSVADVASSPTVQAASRQAEAQQEAEIPDLILPPAQAAAWKVAWQAQADCMHAHGIADFPNAPATFGNGKTPAPMVGGATGSDMAPTSPAFQAASAACPFDTSQLTAAVFQQAWNQWRSSKGALSTGSG